MPRIDYKHIAFHVLVALYFIWAAVFGVLVVLSFTNSLGPANTAIDELFLPLMGLNLLMGTVLVFVIRLFRNRPLLTKIIAYTFGVIAAASIVAVILISIRA